MFFRTLGQVFDLEVSTSTTRNSGEFATLVGENCLRKTPLMPQNADVHLKAERRARSIASELDNDCYPVGTGVR